MKISVSIMAHPDRAPVVDSLKATLGAPARVAFDMDGPPSRDPARIWNTARRAWEMHDEHADWHLLLQDDAVPAAHLLEQLPAALKHVPARCVVSLYLGSGRPMATTWNKVTAEADAKGAAWIVGPRCLWGVALLLPTSCIPDMIAYGNRQHGIPDDMRVQRWAQRERMETWYPWPSLVDHPDAGSIIGHGTGRTARAFRGDARGADWSGPVVRLRRA